MRCDRRFGLVWDQEIGIREESTAVGFIVMPIVFDSAWIGIDSTE
jgi:hypothetical protein